MGSGKRKGKGKGKGKRKRKLTAAEKAAKKRWREEHTRIFVNGKQKWIRRPTTIEGMDPDEFIRRNADPIWLHQEGLWWYFEEEENLPPGDDDEDDIPF